MCEPTTNMKTTTWNFQSDWSERVQDWREGSSKIRLGVAGAVHSISTAFSFPIVIYYEVLVV